jgi:hypothetical protein
MPELKNSREGIAFIVSIALVIITAIGCATYYSIIHTQSMKSNIESAIVKGIDPLAVKCAYSNNDTVCVAYAVSHGQVNIPKK